MHLSTFYRKKDPSDSGHIKLMEGVIVANSSSLHSQICLEETVMLMFNIKGQHQESQNAFASSISAARQM